MSLADCRVVPLPRFIDERGSLSVVESMGVIPFAIARVYYFYDVPAGQVRAAHGHRCLQQLVIAMTGAFEVELDDGYERQRFRLDRPDLGLYIAPGIWRDLNYFSGGAVGLVLASAPYDEADYLRDYAEFVAFARTRP